MKYKRTEIYHDNYAHFSKKRYRLYHRKLQKKYNRFHFDSAWTVESVDGIYKEMGIQKNSHYVDDYDNIDPEKDGNT